MIRVFQFLKSLFAEETADASKLAELRLEFKARFHSFKALLQANNNALEQMAAMEKALADRDPFGMPFIKAATTATTVDVFRMIRSLDELIPGKYSGLDDRFSCIQKEIVEILAPRTIAADEALTIPFDAIRSRDSVRVGSKMARLCEARNQLQLNVPDGFVVTAAAYRQFLAHNDLQIEINRRFQMADYRDRDLLQQVCEEIGQLILEAEIPESVSDAVHASYQLLQNRIGRRFKAALRSSAIGEDTGGTSFAGQYLSRLNVGPDSLIRAYREVVASKYSLQAVVYRYNCGLKDEDIAMCAGCMEMIPAMAGGVVYSRDPVGRTGHMIINSSWGLPGQVVDGSSSCDQILVSRDLPHPIIESRVEKKQVHLTCSADEGTRLTTTAAHQVETLSLDPDQAARLAHWALQLERHFHSSQDMEWAVDESGQIHLLQCRPLSQMIREERIHPPEENQSRLDNPVIQDGITVSPGAGWGPVSIVESTADIPRFLPGSVLVTRLALPCWAPLLDRAAAIVTERGSFAGHLGSVAREFGVPALFGVSRARERLRSEASITVDAVNTQIFRGKQDSLLTRSKARKNLIAGSPVFDTLKKVSRLIVPLNLIDPDSTGFQAESCNTLHDITRFIHEKSVQEIFNFGREFHFTEKTAKQLLHEVPMQWWVLNLDDGFSREVDERYIRLADICSIPMQALWSGIIAVPWEGPPRIDGRGLMSVLFQATTNQALNGSGRSRAVEKNYFMVSRHFCSFTSRLGFHFSTVEAIVGSHLDENYICFQYRGGAADIRRRQGRIRFLADILQENGFIANIREDTLVARMEKRGPEVMFQKLKIVGYITIHSRQLDMIMTNSASIRHYREKFRRDIQFITADRQACYSRHKDG